MKLRLTDFKSNTYEDTDGTCECHMYTGMLDHPTYEFTTNHGDKHTIDGWFSSWGDHIVLDINLPVFTHWLHKVEFKRPKDVADQLFDDYSPHRDLWDEYLWRILDSASYCSTEQELNDNLAWALLDASAGNN